MTNRDRAIVFYVILTIILFLTEGIWIGHCILEKKEQILHKIPLVMPAANFMVATQKLFDSQELLNRSDSLFLNSISDYLGKEHRDPGDRLRQTIAENINMEFGLIDEDDFEFYGQSLDRFLKEVNLDAPYQLKFIWNDGTEMITLFETEPIKDGCPFRNQIFINNFDRNAICIYEMEMCICGLIMEDLFDVTLPFVILNFVILVVFIIILRLSKKNEFISYANDYLMRIQIHDMRSPLSVVYSSIDLLSTKQSVIQDPESSKLVDIAMINVHDLGERIDLPLIVGSKSRKDLIKHSDRIDLAGYFDALFEYVRVKYPNACLTHNIKPGYYIQANTLIFESITKNIINNSMKYSKETPSLNVSIVYSEKRKSMLLFEDNGCGMARKDVLKAFKLGFRSSDVKSESGFGIGLYSVVLYAHAYGWNVSFDSRKGKGTRVTLLLDRIFRDEC